MTAVATRTDALLRAVAGSGRLRLVGAMSVLGAVSGLGQSPWGLWPLTLLGLAVALAVAARTDRAGLCGWSFGLGYFGWTLQWIVNPFFVDAARDGWMAPFAVVFMAGGLALFWALAFALGRRIGGLPGIAAALGLAEVARALLFTGFPWALLGHVWIDTPLAHLAAFGGPFLLTALTLALGAVLARFGLRLPGLVALGLLPPLWLALDPGPATESTGPLIRIVQPNAPQDEKWDPGKAEDFHRRLLALTAEGEPADLTVWPETAVPWLLEYSGELLAGMAEAARRQPLVTGIQRRDGDLFYNSLVLLGPEGEVAALYDKWHLVPFGEYIPFGDRLADWGIRGLAARDGGGYAAGPGPALIDLPGIGPALPLICYEGIFAEEVNAAPARPRVLLLITNDAWFGTRSGPQQHFAQGRLRAIEQGLPMIRSANTGISALIDGKGRILGALPMGQAGALTLVLPPALPPTPYARLGDTPPILLLLLALGISAALSHRRSPERD